MENEEIFTTEYDTEMPQTKERNAFYAAKRREAQAKTENEESLMPEPDLMELIRQQHDALAEDLMAIRKKYPDEAAKTVSDLGSEFVNLCACGMPSLIAYEQIRAKQSAVPYMGDVNTEFAEDKEFYTKAEVDTMTKQQMEKNYAKIRNSMKKW